MTLMIESWVNLFTMFTLYTMYTIDSDAVKIVVQYLKYNYKKAKEQQHEQSNFLPL